jgi:hypothetical protein
MSRHIHEFPIDWTCDRDSRLSLTRNPRQVLRKLMDIQRAMKLEEKRDMNVAPNLRRRLFATPIAKAEDGIPLLGFILPEK